MVGITTDSREFTGENFGVDKDAIHQCIGEAGNQKKMKISK